MAVSFTSVKCPECGADFQIEEGRDMCFCTYCGNKILITNENEHIYRTVDEARVKEAEAKERIRLKELEIEEKENAQDRKSKAISYAVAAGVAVVGALICLFSETAGLIGVVIGMYIAIFTYTKSDNTKKKKRRYVNPDEIVIDEVMLYYREKNYNNVAQMFKSAGFIYVNAIPMDDLNFITQGKNGQVETVTIDGREDYEEGDVFRKNAPVLITYHSR